MSASPSSKRLRAEALFQVWAQVWAGLEISPFTNVGVFCDVVIRKCPKYKVEKWGEYDRNYHFDYKWGRELA